MTVFPNSGDFEKSIIPHSSGITDYFPNINKALLTNRHEPVYNKDAEVSVG